MKVVLVVWMGNEVCLWKSHWSLKDITVVHWKYHVFHTEERWKVTKLDKKKNVFKLPVSYFLNMLLRSQKTTFFVILLMQNFLFYRPKYCTHFLQLCYYFYHWFVRLCTMYMYISSQYNLIIAYVSEHHHLTNVFEKYHFLLPVWLSWWE